MSEQSPTPDAANQPPNQNSKTEIRILSQYVRDLSFENPKAGQNLDGRPEIDVQFGVNARRGNENNVFEVTLKLTATAKQNEENVFIAECDYSGMFQIQAADPNMIQPLLLIECPRILFPFARRVISDTTRDGGYPPLMLDPVDFLSLYQRNMAQAQAQRAEQQNVS